MKRLSPIILLMSVVLLFIAMTACGEGPQEAEQPTVSFNKEELVLTRGDTTVVSMVQKGSIDALGIKFVNTDDNVILYSQKDMEVSIKATLPGETELKLVYSGKIVDTLKITVKNPELYVRLPEGKIVLNQGATATVQAVSTLNLSASPVWEVSSEFIDIQSQDYIARITISQDCPNGEYEAKLKVGDQECAFTIIVGA